MTGFRWFFGILTALLLAGWVALMVLGGNFRRSFGASPAGPALALLPGLLMALVLLPCSGPASVHCFTPRRPSSRWGSLERWQFCGNR